MVVKALTDEDKARYRRHQEKVWQHGAPHDELKYPPELIQAARARYRCDSIAWKMCSRAAKYEIVCDYLLELLTGGN